MDLAALREEARSRRRELLLRAAAEIVSSKGVGALTVRRVANAVGASTQTIYSGFGSKQALLDALYDDALEGIGRTLDGVPETAGLDEIVRLATTYRQWALDHPERYAILAAAVSPDGASRIRSGRACERLVDAVRRVARAGAIVGDDHDAIADALWGFCHGMVTLELAGYHPDSAAAAARFMRGGMALLRGFSG